MTDRYADYHVFSIGDKAVIRDQTYISPRLYINISILRPINNKTKKTRGIPAMQFVKSFINIETHGSL